MNSKVDQYMPLREDENDLASIEGDAYNQSANVIMRMLGFIIRIMAFLTGSSKRIYLTVTNNRIITVEVNKMLWFIDGTVRSRSYTPRSVSATGYELARSLIVFKTHYLLFSSGSESYLIKSRGGQPKVMELVSEITALAEKVSSK